MPRGGGIRAALIVAELTSRSCCWWAAGWSFAACSACTAMPTASCPIVCSRPDRMPVASSDRRSEGGERRWSARARFPASNGPRCRRARRCTAGRQQTFSVGGRPASAPGRPRAGDILISADYFPRWASRSSKGRVQRAGRGASPPVVDRQRDAGAPGLPRRGSDRAPDSPQRAFADDVLRRRRTGRERLAGDRRRGRGHPPGEPGRGAGGDDLSAVYADRRARHVPDGSTRTDRDMARVAACSPASCANVDPAWTGGRSGRCVR